MHILSRRTGKRKMEEIDKMQGQVHNIKQRSRAEINANNGITVPSSRLTFSSTVSDTDWGPWGESNLIKFNTTLRSLIRTQNCHLK